MSGSLNLKPGSLKLKPGSLNLKPGSLKLKPGSLKLKPGSLKLKPGCLKLKPGTLKLRYIAPSQGSLSGEPLVAMPLSLSLSLNVDRIISESCYCLLGEIVGEDTSRDVQSVCPYFTKR